MSSCLIATRYSQPSAGIARSRRRNQGWVEVAEQRCRSVALPRYPSRTRRRLGGLRLRRNFVDWSTPSSASPSRRCRAARTRTAFAVLAKRWRVERAISWIVRTGRNVRDYERLVSRSEAHIGYSSHRRSDWPPPPCADPRGPCLHVGRARFNSGNVETSRRTPPGRGVLPPGMQ